MILAAIFGFVLGNRSGYPSRSAVLLIGLKSLTPLRWPLWSRKLLGQTDGQVIQHILAVASRQPRQNISARCCCFAIAKPEHRFGKWGRMNVARQRYAIDWLRLWRSPYFGSQHLDRRRRLYGLAAPYAFIVDLPSTVSRHTASRCERGCR